MEAENDEYDRMRATENGDETATGRTAVATIALAGLLAGNGLFVEPVSQAASAVPATTTSTYEESDGAIEFAGEGRLMGAPGDSAGKVNHLDAKGSVKLTFVGSEVTSLSRVSPTSGPNGVLIDAKKVATVDRYAAEDDKECSKAAFTKMGLAEGEHTIEVVWTEMRNAKASAPTSYSTLSSSPPALSPSRSSSRRQQLTWTDASQYPLAEYVVNWSTNGYDFTPVAAVSASRNSYLEISVRPGLRCNDTVSASDLSNRVSSTSGSRWEY